MASAPRRRRRWSKILPPDLSDLMNDLIKYAPSFITVFDLRESKMREIIREFKKISDEVRAMQKKADKARTVGAVTGIVGGAIFALGIIAVPLTGGLSLAATTAAIGSVAGGTAAAAGGGAVVGANNISKRLKENESAKKVEEQAKQFMEKVELLKEILEEIKTTCEKFEQKKTVFQAENTLTEVEECQRILTRVSDLGKRSRKVLSLALTVTERINNMLPWFVLVFSVSATPEEDRELRESIIQSGDQYQKVFDNFNKMKKELQVFIETTE